MGIVEGKVVVVTGAGRGIGRAVALGFAEQGARVIVNDMGTGPDGTGSDPEPARQTAEEILASGGEALARQDDISTLPGARGVVDATVEAFGRVDVLVTCAGVARDQPLLNIDEPSLDALLSVYVKGTLFCVQAAAGRMREQKSGGRIVVTTGLAGLLGNFGQASYAAASAGVYALARTASIELQRYDIFVNAVAPIAKTRLTERLPMFERVDTMSAEHVAPAYLFLGSPLCGDLTGTVLAVAGGKLSTFRLAESSGQFKDAGRWTAEEIQEHWDTLSKLGSK